jgi:hypothetical protein
MRLSRRVDEGVFILGNLTCDRAGGFSQNLEPQGALETANHYRLRHRQALGIIHFFR